MPAATAAAVSPALRKRRINPCTSRATSASGGTRVPRNPCNRPSTVSAPVTVTTARPLPSTTSVPR